MSVSQGRTVVAPNAQHVVTEQYLLEKKQHQPTGPMQSPEPTKSSAEIGLFALAACAKPH